MGEKCRRHSCLCRTCLTVCGKCAECKEKTTYCENYKNFEQMSIFDPLPNPLHHSVPRHSWEYYGISKARYRQLTEYIQSGRYAPVARQAAHTANEMIAEYILLSVTQNKSYDALKVKWELKEMERIPYCRTDFYGIRRYAMHLFDLEMRRIGK